MYTFMNSNCTDECVYNLIQDTIDNRARGPPIYRSRFSCMVRQESDCSKTGCYRTMGVPKVCLCPPKNYLKKQSRCPISIKPPAVPHVKLCNPPPPPEPCPDGSQETTNAPPGDGNGGDCNSPEGGGGEEGGSPCEAENTECAPCVPCEPCFIPRCRIPRICCNIMKPPVPSPCIQLEIIPRGCKNYVHNNIVKAMRMPARKPAMRFVDHPKGHTQEWCESGYPRKYVYKDTFGCVPSYICDIKNELRRDDCQAKYDMKYKERDIKNQIRHLDPTEHQALVCGLKKNWDQKFHEYQSMSLVIDTAGKLKRRQELEEELKKLEKDIQLLERHNHLFVSETCRSFYLA